MTFWTIYLNGKTEAEFLDEIQTSLKSFPPFPFTVTSTTMPWDFYFFKLIQPLTVSTVQLLCTVKEKGGKPNRKTHPLPYCFRNPYRNLKSENSQDNAHRNLDEIVHSWILLGDLLTQFCLKKGIHPLAKTRFYPCSTAQWMVLRGGFTLRTAYLDMALILANASLDFVYLEKFVWINLLWNRKFYSLNKIHG